MLTNNKMEKGEIFAWTPIIGFDKDVPDKGVSRFLSRMQFIPEGVCLFMFHPDIVHFHEGMAAEVHFPPDFCSYYASPYNEERMRQQWTNFDLKELVDHLNDAGTDPYLSIMGVDLNNTFHDEWLTDHPEIKSFLRNSKASLNVLKRFSDGTYYEDFFADKLCTFLTDYGFGGLHVTDNFCPQSATLYCGDFSADMFDQFIHYSGISPDTEIAALTDDSFESINRRGDWIWENCRAEWITFYAWRWEQFWKKICDRLHAIGKKVIVLGTYCTDPFETLYLKGVDLKGLVRAGVDYLMPNPYPSGSVIRKGRPHRWYEYMSMIPLTDAFADGGKSIPMLSVKDASEEWDMLHHMPMLLERELYTMPSYFRKTKKGMKRSADGMMICLADGIYADEWKWLADRMDIGFTEAPKKILLPTLIWSDAAFYNTLPSYIATRRWTLHKFMYELANLGAYTGATARIEDLCAVSGPLFVPNFDLLTEKEQMKIGAYDRGPVICTASVEEGFTPQDCGITPDIYFIDTQTTYKNCVFAFGLRDFDKKAILQKAEEKDDTPALENPSHAEESTYPLTFTLRFQKVSKGVIAACAMLLHAAQDLVAESTLPIVPMEMEDGRIRLYVANDDRLTYGYATITLKKDIKKVENISKFPLLPVKFSDNGTFNFMSRDYPGISRIFRVKVAPGGVSIVDVYFA